MPSTPHPSYVKLKGFLENRPVCRKASAPLKPHACVRVLFSDHEGTYCFRRSSEGPRLEPGCPEDPDFTLRMQPAMLDRLCRMVSDDIGEFGAILLGEGISGEPELRMSGTIHTGFFDLFRKGYFGILRLGGWKVMKVLAAKGVTGIGAIREKINRNVKPVE